MKNYICLNGQKIELSSEQLEKMKTSLGIGQIELSSLSTKDTFKIGKHEFIVLEQIEGSSIVLLKETLGDSKFGDVNNYNGSIVDAVCEKFADEIADIIGAENIFEHIVDLTADDGLKDYGTIERRMSLLTANDCRRYVEILDAHKLDKWWWTVTAYSTPAHGDEELVKCVSPSGSIDYGCRDDYRSGVRPFCILKSHIFVSK
jgi:hypothetical protein